MTDEEIIKLSYSENKYLAHPSQIKSKEFEEGFLCGYKLLSEKLEEIINKSLEYGYFYGQDSCFPTSEYEWFIKKIEKEYRVKL